MRVQKVRVENFKRFERLDVELGPLECLVGPNNSGKTTLLQALALFDFCVHHCLHRKNGSLELRRRTIAPEDFYVLPVTNPMDIWHERRTMEGGKQRRVSITATFEALEVTATVKLDFNRFGVSVRSSDQSDDSLARLADLRMAYLPVFSMFLPREERRLAAAIEDELAKGRVHSVVRNLLLEIKKQGRADELSSGLQRSFPTLLDMAIEFDEVTDRYITVTYQEKGRPKEFDIFSAGSGFQQFLYLFGFILLRRPTLIMLDEPDVHLHGSLQAVLLNELKRLVHDGKQVLFATHSRELITRVSPENILSLDEGQANRLQLAFDVYDTLDRLGSLDPTQLSLVQAYRRVVVVEDGTDRDLLSVFCGKCLGSETWQQVERRIAFCYSRGNPWKQRDMSHLRHMLQQMIAVHGAALELFVVADRDYHPDRDALLHSLPSEHIRWHVWHRAEIENYLLHVGAIGRLVGTPGEPLLDAAMIAAEFDRLLEQSRNCANDRLVQAFDEWRRRGQRHWDAATMARMAREHLDAHWATEKLALADAKDIVLPGIKRWLQQNGHEQFSDKRLADSLAPDELPDEVHEVALALAEFAGIATMEKRPMSGRACDG